MTTSRRELLKSVGAAAILAEFASIRRAAASATAEAGEWSGSYSLGEDVTYLNHASIGTVPRSVQAAHRAYLELCETNPWLYMWSEPWREPLDEVRARAANALGCEIEEVSINHNTTECFNMLAHGLPLGKGDEVLFSSLNHSGASACWHHMAERRGFTVRQFELPLADFSELTEDQIVGWHAEAVGPRTRLLVLPHIDNMVGLRHPVARIAAAARARGVRWVAVDGAQTVNMIPVDVGTMGVDVYATSAHKWTQSPKGLGFAYIDRSLLEELPAMWVTWGQKLWTGTARVFEDYGTRALPAMLALGDALSFQEAVSMESRERHHRQLRESLEARVDASEGLRWRSPQDWELGGALYAVEVLGRKAADISSRLFNEAGIVVRPFGGELNALRVSPNLANGEADFDRLVAALEG